jgi:hypothetical protein
MSFDVDALIYELAASLPPSQHYAFIDAAYRALEGVNCLGPGLAFRLLSDLQRRYWTPPPDQRAGEPRRYGQTKLQALPAIGRERPDRAVMWRRRAAG